MDKNRWQEVEKLVDQALKLESPSERTAFIKEQCADNEELKKEVTALLDSIEASGGMWEDLLKSNQVLVSELTGNQNELLSNSQISIGSLVGPYLIKELLGRGGMGDVFLAERKDANFHHNVAIKVLRGDVDNETLHERFLQERAILSRLNHPNIARLLDGGVSENGHPYFVMEFVHGLPITEYCTRNGCSLQNKIRLFKQACKAVQYAHTNFVVHRDIKPDNLLVTTDGNLKVLDFGIAKLLDRELSEEDLIKTRAGQRLLSLNYAAPEQITMQPVTAATDVYALGLILFRLLAGQHAFDLTGKNLIEAEEIIRNQSPPAPSQKAGSDAAISSDLDAIVEKALRKEPEDRYESAAKLLEDIERYEQNLPVLAKKGTFGYKVGKFFKRNAVPISVALLFLTGAMVFTGYHIRQITIERNMAELEAEKARKVTELLTGIFEYANPFKQPDSEITALEILDHGTDFIQTQLVDQPEIKASLLSSVGSIYETLGSYDQSEKLLEEALELEENDTPEISGDTYDLAVIRHNLGNLRSSKGDFEAAIENYKEAAGYFEELDMSIYRAGSLSSWGWNEYQLANYEAADSLYQMALDIQRNATGTKSLEYANTLNHMGWLNHDMGDYKNADSLFSEALSIRTKQYEADHPEIATTLHSLGWIKYIMKDYELADSLYKEAIDMRIRIFGDKAHADIAWSKNNLGLVKQAQGKLDEAESLFTEALEIRREVLPETHYHISQSLGNLGSLHFYRQEYDESAAILKEVLDMQRETLGQDHPNLAMYLNNLATVLTQAQKPAEAITYYREALEIQDKHFKSTHSNTMRMRDNLADAYEDLNNFEEAEKLRLTNFEAIKKDKGIEDPQTQLILQNVITLYEKWNKIREKQEYQKMLVQSD